ncbi:MAG: TRAP transporter small permease [Alphaproteobacteria bacterium]|nr:TRAP transporter small permease [Alphaproteobacteria bacterium]
MTFLKTWFPRGAEFIAAAMLAAMFLTFLLQIFSRYVLQTPFGWTLELCLTLWVWIVFFGNAFIVKERDHVTFDIFYLAAPRKVRQALALISAAAIVIGMVWAFLPTWDYINWMKMRKSATLKIPLRTIFSIYALFMIAVAARYAWRFYTVWKSGPPDSDHEIPGHEPEPPAIRHGEDAT